MRPLHGSHHAAERNGRRAAALVALLGLVTLEMLVASCAGAEDEDGTRIDEIDGASLVPTADAGANASEGGCEADACAAEVECDGVEWCPVKTTHPVGVGLAGVWGSGPDDVWIVGAFGSVAHWDGKTWTSVPVDTHWSLRAVWGSGPNDVWTIGAPNQIFRSTGFANGTAKWSPIASVVEAPITSPAIAGAIWGTSSSDVWIAGMWLPVSRPDDFYYELAWRSISVDGGTGWAPVIQDYGLDMIRGVWGSGPEDIWVVGAKSDGLPLTAHSNGVAAADGDVPTWTEVDSQTLAGLYAIWGSGPDDVWTVGDYGTIRHFTASSKLWTVVASPTTENLRGLWGSGPNDIWAVGENGTFLHYDGTEWRTATAAFPPGDKPHLYGVWGSGPTDVWAVGSGMVMHFSGATPDAQGANRP